MKHTLLTAACLIALLPAYGETFNINIGKVTYNVSTSDAGDMTYSGGSTLTVLGNAYDLSKISSMYVDETPVEANTVTVNYNGTEASVTADAALARYLNIAVDGAAVTITQGDEVSASTCGEITYVLKGATTAGSFYLEGSFKATVRLAGVDITNPSGAAIDIQNGKRIKLNIADDTTNKLTDSASGKQKGSLVCKGHLEITGHGSLEVTGKTAHAIYAKEYITLKNASVKVLSSVKDGLNCNQYFSMTSGTLDISGAGDDGIQVSFKDDTDREAEDTGSITISGGTLTASASATASKAIKADGDITVTGGTITATVSGGGEWDSSSVKTKAAACMSADGDMTISGGTLSLTATGCAGKGISVDGNMLISDGDITISTSGGIFAYVNGKEYTNYTGNTDNLKSDYKSSPKGVKADGNITIDGGTIKVTTTGNGGEGIESKAVMTVNGGTITVNSYDDSLNSSSHMYINGGDITVVATNNDGLDSNGNLYIAGGSIMAFGATSPECGIDANEEEGYTVIFTGGTLLAVGGSNSTPSNSSSTQAYVSGSASITANSTVMLKSGSTVLATFQIPSNVKSSSQGGQGGRPGGGGPGGSMSSSSVLITCPGLTSGSSYTLTSGSSSTTVSARLTGSNSSWRP